jgi:hypothetical protein
MAEPSFWQEGERRLEEVVSRPVPASDDEDDGHQSGGGLVLRVPFRVASAPAAVLTAGELREIVAGLPDDAEVILTLEVLARPRLD